MKCSEYSLWFFRRLGQKGLTTTNAWTYNAVLLIMLLKNFSTSHRVYHKKLLFLNLLTPHSRSDCGNIVNDISGALKRPNLLCKNNCKCFYSHIPKDSITQKTSEVDLFNLVCHYCKWYFMNCEDSFLAIFLVLRGN
jgi:hypothetical protein